MTIARRRVHELLEIAHDDDAPSRAIDIFLLILIVLNVLAVILDSMAVVRQRFGPSLQAFEIFSVAVFSLEYLGRLWSCVERPAHAAPVRGRLRYAFSPMAMIDLLAIAPFFLTPLALDLRFMRALRLLRVVRVGKASRYIRALRLMSRVLRDKSAELALSIAVLLILLVMASCLMYFAEHQAQPEAFPHIPSAMWWAVATLSTVGYGDVYPITAVGRLLASLTAVLGIGFFALPAGILGSGFVERIGARKQSSSCPKCGASLAPRTASREEELDADLHSREKLDTPRAVFSRYLR